VRRDGSSDGGDSSEPPFVALTKGEVERCLYAIEDTQHRAIFSLQVEMGLSVGEILGDESLGARGAFIQDIDSKQMTMGIYYQGIKKGYFTSRVVPIPIECLRNIRDYLASMAMGFDDEGKLFDITDRRYRQVLTQVRETTGIKKKVNGLNLRRTAIIKMLREGVSTEEVRRRVGILRERDEIVVYAVGYILGDRENYDDWVKQVILDGLTNRPERPETPPK